MVGVTKAFIELLSLLGDIHLEDNEIPFSKYEAKEALCTLRMDYQNIHTSFDDYILYRKKFNDINYCLICGESRWKKTKNVTKEMIGVPTKVLWYISPISWFKRLFHNAKHAKSLSWHANGRNCHGQLRHSADSPSWKIVDDIWLNFGNEPRNLRLDLSTNGINPHSSLSSKHSC